MASRKEQKEAARQKRIAEEQARAAKARRERRLRLLAGTVIGAVAVVAVAIAISSGGSSGGLKKGKAATATVTEVNSLLKGIPQSGNVLGNPKAPVTLFYYGDLECPICQDFTLHGGFSQLVQNDVRKGKVKIVYSAVETASRDPNVFKTQQIAALAAGKQDKFWNYVELFYHEQGAEDTGYVTEEYLSALAAQAGLNASTWKAARSDSSISTEFTKEVNSASSQAIESTPTLIFQGPKGKAQVPDGTFGYSDLQSALQHVS